MRRFLLTSVAAVSLFGGIALRSVPAHAEVLDTAAIIAAAKKLYDIFIDGTTQITNYLKGQIAAHQQIADASNTAMARFHRDVRNAQIRDEHIATPAACEALDSGQSVGVSGGQSWIVATSLSKVSDAQIQGGPGTPAWYGQGQASAAAMTLHNSRYCSDVEAADGVCRLTSRPNYDVQASTLLGAMSFGENQENISAANDYTRNLMQPVPLRVLRGDELRSFQGQEAQVWRRNYMAQHSLARWVSQTVIATRTNSVRLTDAQKAQQQAQGLQVTERSSWSQAVDLEVNRYTSGRSWGVALQFMPPSSVLREIAKLLALNTYIAWQNYQVNEKVALVGAATLAGQAEAATGRPERALQYLTSMPDPQMK